MLTSVSKVDIESVHYHFMTTTVPNERGQQPIQVGLYRTKQRGIVT